MTRALHRSLMRFVLVAGALVLWCHRDDCRFLVLRNMVQRNLS